MWGALLDQSLPYERQKTTPDGGGGNTRAWIQLLASIPVSVQSASSHTIYSYAERQLEVDYSIFTTADLNNLIAGGIRVGDRLNGGSAGNYLVRGYRRDQNFVITTEPIYQIDCQLLIE